MSTSFHNIHVPLSTDIHTRLKAEAKRSGRPATVLVREAIETWLEERERAALHHAIAHYAQAVAGTSDDLDAEMEKAAAEYLLASERGTQLPEALHDRL